MKVKTATPLADALSMQTLALTIIVATSVWVGIDAASRHWSDNSFADRPWKWAVGALLLWIVIFPLYLVRRGRAPQT